MPPMLPASRLPAQRPANDTTPTARGKRPLRVTIAIIIATVLLVPVILVAVVAQAMGTRR